MTIALGALGVAAAWVMGFAAAPLLTRLNGPQRIGFAYGLGLVWISTMMGVEALVRVPLTPAAGMAVIAGPAVGWWLWRVWRACRMPGGPQTVRRGKSGDLDGIGDPWWWGAAALLAVLWSIVTVRAVLKPIQFWDAWATHGFKAKVIFLEAAIPSLTLFGWNGSLNYPDYPLGVSLQEVWVSWFVGTWDDVAVKLLFPGYLLSLLCLAYGALRERWDARRAMFGTLFVGGLPLLLQHGHDGYTDLPLAYFAFGGAIALTRYVSSDDRRDLFLAAVSAVGLVWTRADGVILVACNALLLVGLAARRSELATKKTWSVVSMYLALPALVWVAWTLIKLHFGISSSFRADGASVVPLFDRWSKIAWVFFRAFFLEGNWLILWALFAFACISRYRETMAEESMFLFWSVVVYLGAIALVFATTGLFRFVEDGTVLHRLILHVAPLAALWVATVFGRRLDGTVRRVRPGARGAVQAGAGPTGPAPA